MNMKRKLLSTSIEHPFMSWHNECVFICIFITSTYVYDIEWVSELINIPKERQRKRENVSFYIHEESSKIRLFHFFCYILILRQKYGKYGLLNIFFKGENFAFETFYEEFFFMDLQKSCYVCQFLDLWQIHRIKKYWI